jgi:hypothetical protein
MFKDNCSSMDQIETKLNSILFLAADGFYHYDDIRNLMVWHSKMRLETYSEAFEKSKKQRDKKRKIQSGKNCWINLAFTLY